MVKVQDHDFPSYSQPGRLHMVRMIHIICSHPHDKAVDISTAQGGEKPWNFLSISAVFGQSLDKVEDETNLDQSGLIKVHLTERASNAKVRRAEQSPSLAAWKLCKYYLQHKIESCPNIICNTKCTFWQQIESCPNIICINEKAGKCFQRIESCANMICNTKCTYFGNTLKTYNK